MYRIAICEDEPVLLKNIHELCSLILDELSYPCRICDFLSGDDLYDKLQEKTEFFDLLLLDIQMEGTNGMELAHRLRQENNRTSIIFITGCVDYLLEGYSVQPIQYLLKPIEKKALAAAIQTDLRLNHVTRTISLESGRKRIDLNLDDIIYVESMDHYLYIHMTEQTLTFPFSLSKAQEMLPADMFCRCHKSFLVNMSQIADISRTRVLLKNDTELPAGRSYFSDIQSSFVRYLNRL